MRIYLVSTKELDEVTTDSPLWQEALAKVDCVRREKIMRLSQASKQKVSLAAGLLLQYAVQEYGRGGQKPEQVKEKDTEAAMREVTASEPALLEVFLQDILSAITTPQDFTYTYGENGKPYFAELPLYFNLSHSEDYVLCAVADVEVGADIQRMEDIDYGKLAQRFFCEEELAKLQEVRQQKEMESQQLFYQLWARKEAYGKLTGEGLGRVIGMNTTTVSEELLWKEYDCLDGYCIAVCWKRGKV